MRDLEHQNKIALTEAQGKLNEAKQACEDINNAKQNLLEKVKMLETAKARLVEESES